MTDPASPGRWPRAVAITIGCVIAGILAAGPSAAAFAVSRTATPRPPGITVRIELARHAVRSGRTVSGELTVENQTRSAKVLLSACRVDGLYAIGLRASDGDLQDPAFPTVACGHQQRMVARPGVTIFRFELPTTYIHCVQTARHRPPRSSPMWAPLCRRSATGEPDIMPPLPPGRYTAVFFPDGTWHGPRVRSAGLRITGPR